MEEKKENSLTLIKLNRKVSIFYFFVFAFFVNLFITSIASAASLYLSPSSGSYTEGDSLSMSVYVSSDSAINAISGILAFPQDKLEVISLSKGGSIMNLWVREPAFSNTGGTVSMEGVVLNPGFIGKSGKILTINFKAKSAGSAYISFNSGSVLANDGYGTNVLSSLGEANFTINEAEKKPTPEPVVYTPGETPTYPVVMSPTHPDPDGWSNIKDPVFIWKNASDTTGVNFLANRNPASNPGVVSDGMMETYKFEDVDDGEWYFHIRFRNSSGWGEISHFKFNIDTVEPKNFSAELVSREDTRDPVVELILDAEDDLSGMSYYKVVIDGVLQFDVPASEDKTTYRTPKLEPGEHILKVLAFDKAENFLEKGLRFIVDPVEAPRINPIESTLDFGQDFVLSGEAVPNSLLKIWLEKEGVVFGEYMTSVMDDGKFVFSNFPILDKGSYKIRTQTELESSAKSEITEPILFVVKEEKEECAYLYIINVFLMIIFILGLALIIAVIVAKYYSDKLNKYKNEYKDESGSVENLYVSMKKDMIKEISWLERIKLNRSLTKEESRLLRHIKKSMSSLDNIAGGKIGRSSKKKTPDKTSKKSKNK